MYWYYQNNSLSVLGSDVLFTCFVIPSYWSRLHTLLRLQLLVLLLLLFFSSSLPSLGLHPIINQLFILTSLVLLPGQV